MKKTIIKSILIGVVACVFLQSNAFSKEIDKKAENDKSTFSIEFMDDNENGFIISSSPKKQDDTKNLNDEKAKRNELRKLEKEKLLAEKKRVEEKKKRLAEKKKAKEERLAKKKAEEKEKLLAEKKWAEEKKKRLAEKKKAKEERLAKKKAEEKEKQFAERKRDKEKEKQLAEKKAEEKEKQVAEEKKAEEKAKLLTEKKTEDTEDKERLKAEKKEKLAVRKKIIANELANKRKPLKNKSTIQGYIAYQRANSGVSTKCFPTSLRSVLAKVEKRYGVKPIVNSGFRSASYNRRVGGARRSYHIKCMAADIRVPGVGKYVLARYLKAMSGVGGVGTYGCKNIVHVDVGPKRNWHWRCRKRGHKA